MAADEPDQWFRQGCDAFTRTFPKVAKKVPWTQFYICPLCLVAYSREAMDQGALTVEHVPPRSVGGSALALTCVRCNSRSGSDLDSHMRLEADVYDFARGRLRDEVKVDVRTSSSGMRLPGRLTASESGILFFGRPDAARPGSAERFEADMAASVGSNDSGINVAFRPFSRKRAQTSWLRSAYLAFFAALGYRFICRSELTVVRERIKDPDGHEPRFFRIIRRERSHPRLVAVDAPGTFRCYLMLYDYEGIFLPAYGDGDLYRRLAGNPDLNVQFSGREYPWPKQGPMFLHDVTDVDVGA